MKKYDLGNRLIEYIRKIQYFSHVKYGRQEMSSIVQHIFEKRHSLHLNSLKLITQINNIIGKA